MFELRNTTQARLASINRRVEKHGDEYCPAVSLGIEITTGNQILDLLDASLRRTLYRATDNQPMLPGVEVSTPLLNCDVIDRVVLEKKFEGWNLSVDDSIDADNPMCLGGCKVDKFSIEPQQGGTVVLRFRVGTSDVDAEKLGALAMHNGQSIWILLTAPEDKPDEKNSGGAIDGSVESFEKDHPGLFPPPGDDETDGEGSEIDSGLGESEEHREANAEATAGNDGHKPDGNVFGAPRTPRTKRGRDATAAFIANAISEAQKALDQGEQGEF